MSLPGTDKLKLIDLTDSATPVSAAAVREEFTLHFSLALESGEIIDSNFEGQPARFSAGDGNLPAAFEHFVQTLQEGATQSVTLTPEEAFGLVNEDNIRIYPHYQFPADMALETGLVVTFRDSAGNEQAGVIRDINRQHVTVDFNHPLAGKIIVFTARIITRKISND